MPNVNTLLSAYAESHQHPTNKILHWIDVPLIYWSVVALLWGIKLPVALPFFGGMALNGAMIGMLLAFVYYVRLSFPISMTMLLFSVICLIKCWWWETHVGLPLWMVGLAVFVFAWAGQFVGHKIEGKKPSFVNDVQFFLIGPAWIVAALYKALGIKY